MSATVIPFPSRAQPRDTHVHAPARRGCVKAFDPSNGNWVVYVIDENEPFTDPVALGRYLDEPAADRRIARWIAETGSGPKGAA